MFPPNSVPSKPKSILQFAEWEEWGLGRTCIVPGILTSCKFSN